MTFTKEYTNTKKRSLAPIIITVEAENGREAFTKIFQILCERVERPCDWSSHIPLRR